MCGIFGFTGGSFPAVIKEMADRIVHRGPDDDGFFEGEGVSLGMRRLSIVDVSTGKQPVHNEDSSVWCVFNGEIYNFPELRTELESQGHKFYTHHSDTELIVHLYEQYGASFPHKINGMFGIALWDVKRRELLLIRDRMGVKPLFYARVGEDIVFGSEIKSVLAHPSVRKSPCFEALYHYFSLKNIPAPLTAFDGILSLRPGEALRFKDGAASLSTWWTLEFRERHDADEASSAARILEILEDATKVRMRCDVPFGAYLSGGVDSSAVVALMARASGKPVKTFSLGYEGELKNKAADIHFARNVSKMFGTEHFEYIMKPKELTDDIGEVIGSFDQPFSGTISTFFLSKLIKRHVKVALSGDGADELFGSYLSHRIANPIWHFAQLRAKFNSGMVSEDDRRLLAPCDPSYLARLLDRAGSSGEEAWRYALYLQNDAEKAAFLSPSFLDNAKGVSTRSLVSEYFSGLSATGRLNRILEMEWRTQLPDNVLAFVDFLSMAHSIEVRSPFLDYRLVEFAATLPDGLKIRNGVVKSVLKTAVKPILPPGVTERPKEGFVLPVFDWMAESLKGYIEEVLDEKRVSSHGFFNSSKLGELVRRHLSGDKSQVGIIWNAMMFQVWWERYFGK